MVKVGKLIIDGNSVYGVDEECLKKREVPAGCKVAEAIRRQEQERKEKKNAR
jgi:hypothetical protein